MSHEPAVADVAYQGRPGAYSEAAARRLCGADVCCLPCDSLRGVFDAVGSGRARQAVVPIENSLAGAVPDASRLLLGSGLAVYGEAVETIDHVLVGSPGSTLDGLQEVVSHPVALAQCDQFFRRRPHLRATPVFDTAGAIEMIVQDADSSRAAIASWAAATRYRGLVLAESIQDSPGNYTRFFLVGPPPGPPPSRGPGRIVLAVRPAHRLGQLAAVFATIASFDVNVTRIECLPLKDEPFAYEFLLEGRTAASSEPGGLVEALERSHGAARLLGCVPLDYERQALRAPPARRLR